MEGSLEGRESGRKIASGFNPLSLWPRLQGGEGGPGVERQPLQRFRGATGPGGRNLRNGWYGVVRQSHGPSGEQGLDV